MLSGCGSGGGGSGQEGDDHNRQPPEDGNGKPSPSRHAVRHQKENEKRQMEREALEALVDASEQNAQQERTARILAEQKAQEWEQRALLAEQALQEGIAPVDRVRELEQQIQLLQQQLAAAVGQNQQQQMGNAPAA